jgi:hypothetical protein
MTQTAGEIADTERPNPQPADDNEEKPGLLPADRVKSCL